MYSKIINNGKYHAHATRLNISRMNIWTVMLAVLLGFGIYACAKEESKEVKVKKKLESIIIPEIDFKEANIRDVITFLVKASREYDPKKEGVNIILNLKSGGKPQADSKNPFKKQDDKKNDSAAKVSLITLNARNVSILNVLDIITQMAGLKYRIKGNVVMIVPADAPDGKIIHRTYDVTPSIENRIRELGESK